MALRESKGWKGFLVILKVKSTQLHQKRTTPRWWLHPLPLETRGGDSFPHGGGLSPNSEWGHFYTLDSYSCTKCQGKSTFHKPPDYLLNSDKRATNCVVNKSVNFSLVRPGLESRLSHIDLWPQIHELLPLPPLRVATLGLLWGFNEIMSVTYSAHGLVRSKRSSNNNSNTNKNSSNCDDIIMVVAEVGKRYCP